MTDMEMKEGSFFSKSDIINSSPVAVISEKVNKQLFGDTSGVGKKINVSTIMKMNQEVEVEIIGIFKENQQLSPTPFSSVHICLPYSLHALGEQFFTIWAQFNTSQLAQTKTELERLILYELFRDFEPQIELSFFYRNEKNLIGLENADQTFSIFIGVFAIVSIMITAVGILSIMLITVVEQTREIGLRRALGVSRLGIIKEILFQSVFVSIIGGVIGVSLGSVLYKPLVKQLFFKQIYTSYLVSLKLSPFPLLASFVFILLIGFIAGLYPAVQASQFSPVEALRDHL